MGPKAATLDERLQFILQCLHSIRDANGNLVAPDYNAVGCLQGIKKNSAFVRFRDISNREFFAGVPGLRPIGKRAIAMAAASQINMGNYASYPTPAITPATTALPTASSSPAKRGTTRKRKRASSAAVDSDEDDDDWDWDSSAASATVKKSRAKKSRPSTSSHQPSSKPTYLPSTIKSEPHSEFDLVGHTSFDFDNAVDLLGMDDNSAIDALDHSTDADADGESDLTY